MWSVWGRGGTTRVWEDFPHVVEGGRGQVGVGDLDARAKGPRFFFFLFSKIARLGKSESLFLCSLSSSPHIKYTELIGSPLVVLNVGCSHYTRGLATVHLSTAVCSVTYQGTPPPPGRFFARRLLIMLPKIFHDGVVLFGGNKARSLGRLQPKIEPGGAEATPRCGSQR